MRLRRTLRCAALPLLATLLLLPVSALAQEQGNSCIQCHQSQPGRLGEPVGQWRGSIHAASGIACQSCHGGDPSLMTMEAMSPEKGFRGAPADTAIPAFCGRCHVGVEKDYRHSAHGEALGSGGPQCVTCHGSHQVRQATPALINPEDCSRCHDYGRAATIKEAVATTDALISRIGGELEELHGLGFATGEMEKALFSARNQFHSLFHTVDVEKVRAETETIRSQLGQIEMQVDDRQETIAHRQMAGGGVVGLLLLAGILAGLIRRSYHEDEESRR